MLHTKDGVSSKGLDFIAAYKSQDFLTTQMEKSKKSASRLCGSFLNGEDELLNFKLGIGRPEPFVGALPVAVGRQLMPGLAVLYPMYSVLWLGRSDRRERFLYRCSRSGTTLVQNSP